MKGKVKKNNMNFPIAIVIFYLLIIFTGITLMSQNVSILTSLIRQFSENMQLTQEQTGRINGVFLAAEEQMNRDRAMFKKNEPALIEAALRRRDMTEKHIQSILEPTQIKKYNQEKELLYLNDNVITLMETLTLSFPETYRVSELIKVEQRQAATDRETYKSSAQALIATAIARKDMTDKRIEAFLSPQQQEKYQLFKQQRDADRELFELKEGLILNNQQIDQVEKILAEFHRDKPSEGKRMRGQIGMNGAGFGGGMMPGGGGDSMMSGGGGGGSMMPGGGGGGGGMMPGGGGNMMGNRGGGAPPGHMNEMMKKQEAEKVKRIEVLLTPEQRVLFAQIQQNRNKEMQDRMLQMQGRTMDSQ